jgi:hypothetical protein
MLLLGMKQQHLQQQLPLKLAMCSHRHCYCIALYEAFLSTLYIILTAASDKVLHIQQKLHCSYTYVATYLKAVCFVELQRISSSSARHAS